MRQEIKGQDNLLNRHRHFESSQGGLPALWLRRHNRQCAGAQLTGGRKVWLGAMRAVSDEMVLTLSAGCTEIIGNLGGFFQILREWDQKERAQQNPVSEEPTPVLDSNKKSNHFNVKISSSNH